MRGLLRAFLSPAVADRYASALQPIAVADRDAALAGAVSTLRARFFVLPEEIGVALVEDAGWSVADVATLLGLPTMEVRAALRAAAGEAEPRIGATPPPDLDDVDDEAAAVEAMLADLPQHRRDAGAAAEAPDTAEPVDVELSTTLPGHVGLPDLEAQFRRADRIQRAMVNLTIVAVLALLVVTVDATRPADPVDVSDDDRVAIQPTPAPDRSPTPSRSPGADVPVGDPMLDAARFVATVDPASGRPGRTLTTAPVTSDPRVWLRLAQLPAQDVLLRLTFTAPSGRSTVRPVLVSGRTPVVSVRLPDELGRDPGRYAARIEADDMDATVIELQLTSPDAEEV